MQTACASLGSDEQTCESAKDAFDNPVCVVVEGWECMAANPCRALQSENLCELKKDSCSWNQANGTCELTLCSEYPDVASCTKNGGICQWVDNSCEPLSEVERCYQFQNEDDCADDSHRSCHWVTPINGNKSESFCTQSSSCDMQFSEDICEVCQF